MTYTDVDPGDTSGEETGEQQKLTQKECNYRRGSPMKHCGVCVYYEGDATKSCSKVAGPISGFGMSDVFEMQSNPFGSRIGPQEANMIDRMMSSPPDQSPAAQAQRPAVQIGSRSYGGAR